MLQENKVSSLIDGGAPVQRYLKALLSLDSLVKPSNGAAATFGAILGPLIDQLFNSGKFWAYALFFSIVIADWIAGSAAAKKSNSFRSDFGHAAIARTILLLWLPFIGWLLDKVSATVFHIQQPGIAYYALTLMLAYASWVSMTANCYRAGWRRWIPKWVVDFVSSEIRAKVERAMSLSNGSGNKNKGR